MNNLIKQPSRKQEVIDLHNNGLTVSEVVAVTGLALTTVQTYLVGKSRDRKRKVEAQRSIAYNLYQIFKSISVVAEKMNIPRPTAAHYLNGVEKFKRPKKAKPIIQKKIKAKSISNRKNKLDTNKSGKGIAVVKPRDRVFKSIDRNPDDYRMVVIPDGKNTIKFIKKTDSRSDQQVIDDFLNTKKQQLQALKLTQKQTT